MPAVAQGASPVITSASAFTVDEGVEPVATLTASDADGDGLSWRVADPPGSDGAAFNLAENGDLSSIAAPDYEVPGDADADRVYEVTVEVGDGTNTATADLEVTVRDVAPGLAGPAAVSHPEGKRGLRLAAYSVADGDAWALGGADADTFTVAGGLLRFVNPPDYESPTDADGDNVYAVTVQAGDGTTTETHAVEVTVTDMDEPGSVTVSGDRPKLGVALEAVLTDPDEVSAGALWRWERALGREGWEAVDGATAAAYTPTAADADRHLRVKATYTDGHGGGKSATLELPHVVIAHRLSALTASGLTGVSGDDRAFYPAFDPDTLHYAARCTESVSLTAVTEKTAVRLSVDGVQRTSGTAFEVDDLHGESDIRIVLADAAGASTTYTVHCIDREEFPQLTTVKSAGAMEDLAMFKAALEEPRHRWRSYLIMMDNNGVPRFRRHIGHRVYMYFRVFPDESHPRARYAYMRNGWRGGLGMVVLDKHFRILDEGIHILPPFNGTDGHDIMVRPDGDYVLMAYSDATRDLRFVVAEFPGVRGKFGRSLNRRQTPVKDSVIQIRTADGTVKFNWNAWDHVAIEDCIQNNRLAEEYAHLNSLGWVDGDLIAGFRHCNKILRIDVETGDVVWRAGASIRSRDDWEAGRTSQSGRGPAPLEFVNDPAGGFGGQHGGHLTRDGNLLVYDNSTHCQSPAGVPADAKGLTGCGTSTRAVEYAIDLANHELVFQREFRMGGPNQGGIAGHAEPLANNDWLVSWSFAPPPEESAVQVEAETDSKKLAITIRHIAGLEVGVIENTRVLPISPVALAAPVEPLEASFVSAPETHDGADDRPTVVVAFNRPVSNLTGSGPSVVVSGARAEVAPLVESGKPANAYAYTLHPAGDGEILFRFEGGHACGTGGICAADSTLLTSFPEAITVHGPVVVGFERSEHGVTEAGTVQVGLTLDRAHGGAGDLEIPLVLAEGTASSEDLSVPASVSFGAEETAKTVAVAALEDLVVEGEEWARIELGELPGEVRAGAVVSTRVTVDDATDATLHVSVDADEVPEGGAAELAIAPAAGVSFATDQVIGLTMTGTADAADYTVTADGAVLTEPYELVLPAGLGRVGATVAAHDDLLVEGGETVVITADHAGSILDTVTLRVADGDAAEFAVSAAPAEVDEGEVSTVTVSIDNGVTFAEAQTLSLAVAGDVDASDYTLPATVELAAGAGSATATFEALADHVAEAAETATVTASLDGVELGSSTLTVSDPPLPGVGLDGVPQVGSTLTASLAEDADASPAYQWLRDGAEVPGATGSAYVLGSADVGARMSVRAAVGARTGTSVGTVPVWGPPGNPPVLSDEQELLGTTMTLGSAIVPATVTNEAWLAGYMGAPWPASFGSLDAQEFELDGVQYRLTLFAMNDGGVLGFSTEPVLPSAEDLVVYWDGYRLAGFESQTDVDGRTSWSTETTQPSAEYRHYYYLPGSQRFSGPSDGVRVAVSLRREVELPWGARLPERDIELTGASSPAGLWSDGVTMWAAPDWNGAALDGYDLATGARRTASDLTLDSGKNWSDLWSDGDTLWASSHWGEVVAYGLSDGVRREGRDLGFDALSSAGSDRPTGLWSDGETLWVVDETDHVAYAFGLSDGARTAPDDIDLSALEDGAPTIWPWGAWSDGEILLTSDKSLASSGAGAKGWVRGYRLVDGQRSAARAPELDIHTGDAGNTDPLGLWSDGETLWVLDRTEGRVYAYATSCNPATCDSSTGDGDTGDGDTGDGDTGDGDTGDPDTGDPDTGGGETEAELPASRLGNVAYSEAEVWKPVSVLPQTAAKGYTVAFMAGGYVLLPWAPDIGGGARGIDVWDLSDPRNPSLVRTWPSEVPQQHGVGLWNRDGQVVLAMHVGDGMRFYDVTSPAERLPLIGRIRIPTRSGTYHGIRWISAQAPYFYGVALGDGLYVVDASDPTSPTLAASVPTGKLGGVSPSVVHAVGNLLLVSEIFGHGHATLDIADPANPVLIESIQGASGYSHLFTAGLLLTPGGIMNGNNMYVYTVGRDGRMRYAGEAGGNLSEGGYGSYQDGHFFGGFGDMVAKFSIDPPELLATGTSGLNRRDEDFAHPFGNLILAADDHGSGTALIPHQAQPDTTGPEVIWNVPAADATGVAVTTPIGVSMSDSVVPESVNAESFRVEGPDGVLVPGHRSISANNVNFVADGPFEAGTRYRVEVCGIVDPVGNAGGCTEWSFTTENAAAQAPGCRLDWRDPVETGFAAAFEPVATEGDPTAYEWDFGNGSTVVPESGARTTFAYDSPGRYPVVLEVSNAHGSGRCSTVQIVHAPVTESPPVSSSSIVTTLAENVRVSAGVFRDLTDIYVVNPDNDSVTRIFHDNTRVWTVAVGDNPRTLAEGPNGNIWVANRDSGNLTVLTPEGSKKKTISLGRGSAPYGIVFAPDGGAGYVTLEGTGELAKLSPGGNVVARLDVGPRPRGIAVTGDSRRILVTRFVSEFANGASKGEVYDVDARTFAVTRTIGLGFASGPDSESRSRGVPNYLSQIRISPDGASAWVPSKQDNVARGEHRDGRALNFESQTRAIASRIDLAANSETLGERVDFNDRDLAQALAFTPAGDAFAVVLQGSNAIEVWDANRRTRIGVADVGRAPSGLAFKSDGRRLYVHNFLDRSVTVLNTAELLRGVSNQPLPVATVATVEEDVLAPDVLRGKRIFYNAADRRMNLDGYISCASCHLDGGSDGMVWDRTQFGEGLRNTIDLWGRRGTNGGFVHWTANFDEIQDFEHDMRDAFGGTGFMTDADFGRGDRDDPLGDPKAGVSTDLDDLAAYVSSLDAFPDSPHKAADGTLTEAGRAGKAVFLRKNCARCHSGSDFTDDAVHDVGTGLPSSGRAAGRALAGINTPTLKGLWLSAPYLHDGRHGTLLEVLGDADHTGGGLTATEKSNLVAYLRQLDDGDEAEAPPAVSVGDAEAVEGDGELAFTVTLDGPASVDATVDYATADGTATAAEDYESTSGALTFAAGETSKTVTVALVDDAADEADETFTLTLSNPAAAELADATATGTIRNDDGLVATFADVPAGHNGTSFTAGLEFSGEVAGMGYAWVRDTLVTATGGTVERASRRSPPSNVAWDLEVGPAAAGTDVVLSLRGGAQVGGRRVVPGGPATVPGQSLSVADADALEGETVSFEVTLDRGATGTVTVDYATRAGTADSDDDYEPASGTLSFGEGEMSKTVGVALVDDEVDEVLEKFTLTLSNASGAGIGRATATGIIRDNDDDVRPSLSVSDATAAEGGTASFAVTLDREPIRRVTAFYSTRNGTARAGEDFESASGMLDFAAGESSTTVAVAVLDDTVAEYDETFTLELVTASGADYADPSGTGTIEDDDAPTARLHTVPAEHGGAGRSFEAGLAFSEEIAGIGYVWVRDTLATATNAEVSRAQRVVRSPPENLEWTLTVAPASAADVVLGLAEGLETPDGRPLRVGDAATVRGPAPVGAHVDGPVLTLVWPAPRDGFGTPSGSDYAVAVDGAPRAVASAEIAGRRAVLVLSAPVSAAATVTVGYVGSAMHPLADASGHVRSAPWDGVPAANVTGTGAPGRSTPVPPPAAGRLGTAPVDAPHLDASRLALRDLTALVDFTALERLDLSDNALTHLRGIEAHAGLRDLDLSGNRIADLQPLGALLSLERLDLSRNGVADIAPLAALAALEVLVLDGNAVSDLGPLTHLAALEHLGLADNAVPDVTPLQDLPRLRRLDLGGNPVADLSPLGDVGSLEWLALPGEPAAAAAALARLTGLRWVWRGEAAVP